MMDQLVKWAPALAVVAAFLGPSVVTLLAWVLKRKENGGLLRRNIALKQLDVDQESKKLILEESERLRREQTRQGERISNLESEVLAARKRELEYAAIFLAMDGDLDTMVTELLAFKQVAELRSVERLARSLQVHVTMGRQVTKAS